MLPRHSTVKLGRNRHGARVYLQGRWLAAAGFVRGAHATAALAPEAHKVVVTLDARGTRVVSGKGEIPVIDLNSGRLARVFAGAEVLEVVTRHGTITITPARTAAKLLTRCRNGRFGDLFAGAGLLSQAAREAGYVPAFAVEIDERYADLYERNHPEAEIFCQDIAQVQVESLPPVELLVVGIPCEPYSKARARDGAPRCAHELGDMVFWALKLVDALNPATVLVEEVPQFLATDAGWILRHALARMGYTVEARVIDSAEHGALTSRKRAVVLATSGAAPVFPSAAPAGDKLATLLESAAEEEWFTPETKPWLFAHKAAQAAKGSGHGYRVVTAESTTVPTITKRYFNGQGDNAVVAHPTRPETYRWLTVREVARLHGLPDSYCLGETKTIAGEALGQGVVLHPFRRLLQANRRVVRLARGSRGPERRAA